MELPKQEDCGALGATTKIGQAGSTIDIRLPKKIIDFFNLHKVEEVVIYPESQHKLVVEV